MLCERCKIELRQKRVRDRTPIGSGSSRFIMTGVHIKYFCPKCGREYDAP